MHAINLIVLSYHRFTAEDNDYPFSRTYKQFRHDLETRDFDIISFDDSHKSIIKAAKMMEEKNFRAKIFTSTSLIGQPNYCDWDDIWRLSRFHDIENHSHYHIKLSELTDEEIKSNIDTAQKMIKENTGRFPRYFVAPWNETDERIEQAANKFGLQMVKDRINMRNDS